MGSQDELYTHLKKTCILYRPSKTQLCRQACRQIAYPVCRGWCYGQRTAWWLHVQWARPPTCYEPSPTRTTTTRTTTTTTTTTSPARTCEWEMRLESESRPWADVVLGVSRNERWHEIWRPAVAVARSSIDVVKRTTARDMTPLLMPNWRMPFTVGITSSSYLSPFARRKCYELYVRICFERRSSNGRVVLVVVVAYSAYWSFGWGTESRVWKMSK